MSGRTASFRVVQRAARLGLVGAFVVACGSPTATPEATPNTPATTPGPVDLDITDEQGSAASALIGAGGGTITATSADGVAYEFVVPPLALPAGTEITMTPISAIDGLPLSGGFAAGVEFEPSGLVLAQPATLTITADDQPPTGQHLVGFSYEGSADSFHAAPARSETGAITILVSHFSTAGAGFGTTQDIEALWIAGSSTRPESSRVAIDFLVTAFFETPRDGAQELHLMELWFDFVILPELEAATTDAQLVAAVGNYALWEAEVPRHLDVYDVVPGGRDAPSLVSRRAAWETAFAAKVRLAIERNLVLCASPGITSARIAALDNAIFWSRMARIAYNVATAANGLDLASFRNGSCAQGLTQELTLDDPLTRGVATNMDATFALRFTDGQVAPANFVITAAGQGAALQFPQFTAATPPGFYTGVVTPADSASVVNIDLAACYAGGDFLLFISSADELCHEETVVREVGSEAITCANDPLTIESIDDDPDKIYVVFDGASTCRLVAEIGDNKFPGDPSDLVLSIDTDPDERTWDGEERDDDTDGRNWQPVGGFGEDFGPGSTRTFRSRHIATGQVFEITVTVRVQFIGGSEDTRMTVEDVRITAAG